jgi:phosphonate transport system ATP-binding protein
MHLLEVQKLTKVYGAGSKALSDINFSVKEGEFVAIIGPSGAGKSTLLRCINRMIDASSGDVIFAGVNVNTLNKKQLRIHRRQIGMIFQHYNLVNRLTVIENVLHGRLGYKSTLAGIMGNYNNEEKRDAFRILEMLGLSDHVYRRCDQLSGGQKQRVGIARALIQHPKMLLCDEPISSLDPSAAKVIMDHLHNIAKKTGITCLVNLHQVDVALRYADRIIGVNQGKTIYDGPANITNEEIYEIYGSAEGGLIFDVGGQHAS